MLITVSTASLLFAGSTDTRHSTRAALSEAGCLVPHGKVWRVDAAILQTKFPNLTVPKEWLAGEVAHQEIRIRELTQLLPIILYGQTISTGAQLRTVIIMGTWWRRQVSYSCTFYDRAQFTQPDTFIGKEEWQARIKAWHVEKKKGELAQSISKLLHTWEECLRERRVGVRRGVGMLGADEFITHYSATEALMNKAPWADKEVRALFKDFDEKA